MKHHGGRLLIAAVLIGASHVPGQPLSCAQAQPPETRPFDLPFADPPGPASWYMIQAYGNTTGAYYWRSSTYRAGQGLHFGVDFSVPCGTPVLAIGDGVVSKVDAAYHGSLPHNLMIDHPQAGYASFYGHLLQRSSLHVGQAVKRGDVVGLSGDPDETCHSRPHLHLEIRNLAYTRAYNPVLLIEADWDNLALVGPYRRGFARDLSAPRQWQFLDDQPEVVFGGPLLNDYANPWPMEWPGW